MTKAELIARIARSRDLPPETTKKTIQQIVDIAFVELGNYFVRSRVTRNNTPRFTVPGFGTFTKKKRSARRGVNPRTLEPMEIKARFTVDFRPGAELKRQLNGRRRGESAAPRQTSLALAVDDSPALPRRPLRTRDEAELDGLTGGRDPSLFGGALPLDLPAAPLQRIAPPRGEGEADKSA